MVFFLSCWKVSGHSIYHFRLRCSGVKSAELFVFFYNSMKSSLVILVAHDTRALVISYECLNIGRSV